jgi:hypothetical protein
MKATSIKLGNENRVEYVSEAKEKFIPQAQSAYVKNPRPMNNVKF